MVLTYRSLVKTYPLVCEAIVDFGHKHQILFEAALDEYLQSRGILVNVESVRDKLRNNKIVGYSFNVQLKEAIGPVESSVINVATTFTRDIYAWQEGVRKALRILEDGLSLKQVKSPVDKVFVSNSISRN